MKFFVSSDIHGFFDEWQLALNNAGFDINNPNHKIIICGDLFDRGRQSKEIVNFILSNKDKIIFVRGNHEDLMQTMIDRNYNTNADLTNGTAYTIIDLCPEWQISEFDLKEISRETGLQEVLDLSVDYFETKHYVFVHSWIPVIENCCLYDNDWRKAREERWAKARWANPLIMTEYELFEPQKTIVFGHWHCSAFWNRKNPEIFKEFDDGANYEPFITENYIALDACTIYSKKVNVIVIEDDI